MAQPDDGANMPVQDAANRRGLRAAAETEKDLPAGAAALKSSRGRSYIDLQYINL